MSKEIDVEAELCRILNEELAKYWDEAPTGYNVDNDAYHMGKGLMVNKETWNKYEKAIKKEPDLNAYEFMIRLIKELSNENKDEQDI